MMENEAIKRLQTLNIILTNKSGHKEDGIEKIFTFSDITAICTAIQALEEIQQYRAIGLTPQMVKDLIVSEKKAHKVALENADMLDEYRAIGTIEEFKALKEKNEPKKAIGKRKYDEAYCPACNEVISDGEFWALNEYVHHCNYCGQAVKGVDWQ